MKCNICGKEFSGNVFGIHASCDRKLKAEKKWTDKTIPEIKEAFQKGIISEKMAIIYISKKT